MTTTHAYILQKPGEPLVEGTIELDRVGPKTALIEVLACGLCHTDLGFADGSVRPAHPLPLVLGHEVVGMVRQAGDDFAHLVGRPVLVPAVLPCGTCAFCRGGRANACLSQIMPGSDIHGGFASEMVVPAALLVPLDGEGLHGLADDGSYSTLCVVADAVSTAYQAVMRSGLARGDLAVVVGAGGVGSFVIQIAGALGADVVACDINSARLALLMEHGAGYGIDTTGRDAREVRKEIRAMEASSGRSSMQRRVFECSGTPGGQLCAFGLLDRAVTMVQVGFTPRKVEIRLSNLMAFDATIMGTWGCPPDRYPDVLKLIAEGKVALDPFVAHAPMSELNVLLARMAKGKLDRRMILDPRA